MNTRIINWLRFFKCRYTIYYQQGTNRFGGVCLAIAHEVPHRLVSTFHAVMYSPPSELLPLSILDRLYRYNRNLILTGDLNARHPYWRMM